MHSFESTHLCGDNPAQLVYGSNVYGFTKLTSSLMNLNP